MKKCLINENLSRTDEKEKRTKKRFSLIKYGATSDERILTVSSLFFLRRLISFDIWLVRLDHITFVVDEWNRQEILERISQRKPNLSRNKNVFVNKFEDQSDRLFDCIWFCRLKLNILSSSSSSFINVVNRSTLNEKIN